MVSHAYGSGARHLWTRHLGTQWPAGGQPFQPSFAQGVLTEPRTDRERRTTWQDANNAGRAGMRALWPRWRWRWWHCPLRARLRRMQRM
ncbi:hypothetical protein CBM2592_A30017 [Cupriavidus taiwanensis]|nr:hypothetical protein CBM2592_A30017 [Cupriavidus taiwanensis]SOY80305.1 hypothetical protein CBM2591_A150008 [Cupriavidus taiwanensis]SOZ51745.1 hypothetical protein CBM2617_A130008 [Cupriavidus taiwanensis]SOZ76633.1 hypothetical protein CBM2622_A130009 [Cupriavidus taiwanensis]SOZ77099.1 hypothetical protein CBM2618_A130009 [Cupriavidus taiwanensis]